MQIVERHRSLIVSLSITKNLSHQNLILVYVYIDIFVDNDDTCLLLARQMRTKVESKATRNKNKRGRLGRSSRAQSKVTSDLIDREI